MCNWDSLWVGLFLVYGSPFVLIFLAIFVYVQFGQKVFFRVGMSVMGLAFVALLIFVVRMLA